MCVYVCVMGGGDVYACACMFVCQFLSEKEKLSLVHCKVDFPVFYQLQWAVNERKCLYLNTVIYSKPFSNVHTMYYMQTPVSTGTFIHMHIRLYISAQ